MPDLTLRRTETEAVVTAGDVDIARYAFDPGGAESEGPKPFLHPVRALDGAPLSAFRPWDHRWHKGLQMTWTHVSGENFWGGPTYSRDEGYVQRDNVGRMRHDAFTAWTDSGSEVGFTERLTWITRGGESWFDETRTHRFHGVDRERGLWMLDFATTLRSIADRELVLGSPTTEGRPDAGYTGFALRMPRAWTGGRALTPASDDPAAIMGSVAPWLAFSGQHDELDGGGTVIFYAGTSSAAPQIRWFVRSEPFPIVSPSASFDETVVLAPGDELRLTHRHVFVDRVLDDDAATALAEELTP